MAESHQRVTVRGAGISLPPKQGNSNNGSFSEHPLNNGYTQKEVEGAAWHRSAIRFGINPATVFDANAWQKTQDVVRWARGAGATVVICMWGSNRNGAKLEGHGDGRVPNPGAARDAWRRVGEVFAGDEEVFFEAFNEPFGYKDANEYVRLMRFIAQDLPPQRVIVDGMGYAGNVQRIKDLWPGLLGYHIYPNWLPPSQRTASNFVALLRRSLRGVEHRTWVTEFGANTCLKNEDYHARGSSRSDIQFLHGLHTAFAILDLPATFVWHGWNNGDCYSLWAATPSARSKLGAIQAKAGGGESLALGSAPGMLTALLEKLRGCMR